MFRQMVYWLGVLCAVASLALFIRLFLSLAPAAGPVSVVEPRLKAQIIELKDGESVASPRRVIWSAGTALGLAGAAAVLVTAGRRGTRRELYLDRER